MQTDEPRDSELRAERRSRKKRKKMRVVGTSVRVLAEIIQRKAEQ